MDIEISRLTTTFTLISTSLCAITHPPPPNHVHGQRHALFCPRHGLCRRVFLFRRRIQRSPAEPCPAACIRGNDFPSPCPVSRRGPRCCPRGFGANRQRRGHSRSHLGGAVASRSCICCPIGNIIVIHIHIHICDRDRSAESHSSLLCSSTRSCSCGLCLGGSFRTGWTAQLALVDSQPGTCPAARSYG